jgi:hypothetical protein
MKMNVKKLVGAVAIAGAMGLPALVLSAGAANAATAAPSITAPTYVQPVDDHEGGWGHHGDWGWGDRGDWDHGGWGDRGDWDHGGWGWGWRWGW